MATPKDIQIPQTTPKLPGYWGTKEAVIPEAAKKALDQTAEARKTMDKMSATQLEGFSQAGGREKEIPADLAIALAKKEKESPTAVGGYSQAGPPLPV